MPENNKAEKFNLSNCRAEFSDTLENYEKDVCSHERSKARMAKSADEVETTFHTLAEAYETLASEFDAYKHQVEQEHARLAPAPTNIIAMLGFIAKGEKIKAIKECCALTGLGLKESKNFIDAAMAGPKSVTAPAGPVDWARPPIRNGESAAERARSKEPLPGVGSVSTPVVIEEAIKDEPYSPYDNQNALEEY